MLIMKDVSDLKVLHIYQKIVSSKDEEHCAILQYCEKYGEGEDEIRYYDVFLIQTQSHEYVLKKTNQKEIDIYQHFLNKTSFHVPYFYGYVMIDRQIWMLIEHMKGNDVREMSDQTVMATANSLSQIENYFCQQNDKESNDRFDQYWKRIQKRALSIPPDTHIAKAYQLFLKRQKECPQTLCHGDFLQWNVIWDGQYAHIIDWAFGGMLPYTLDIARFIAHGTSDKSLFPIYMNDQQKSLFVDTIYNKLEHQPDKSQYLQDIQLAVLNEYWEFVEAKEDEEGLYYQKAVLLADDICRYNIF